MKELICKVTGMKRTTRTFAFAALSALTVSLPAYALAATTGEPGQLVPKCTTGSGGVSGACGYNDLILLGQNFLNWAIYIAMLAAVIAFVWAGWLYMSSAGNQGKISKAHSIFWKVIVGIFVTMGAWLIVKSILGWMGIGSEWTLLN